MEIVETSGCPKNMLEIATIFLVNKKNDSYEPINIRLWL